MNEFCGLSPVKKLREIVKKIVSSPQRRKQFRTIAKEAFGNVKAPSGKPLCSLMVIRDVATRWNYTHTMIRRALMLREAIEKWVFERKELRDELYLSNQEWAFLKQLADILEVFTKVTLYMSRSNTPTLPWAIPMYHCMQTALQSAASDKGINQKLQQACAVGLRKLRHYFRMAQRNHFNTLATICHPVLRLEWFRNLGNDEYTQAKIIFERFIAEYELATPEVASATTHPLPPSVSLDDDDYFLSSIINLRPDGKSTITSTVPIQSEFERYAILAQGAKDSNALNAPLIWWKDHSHQFPTISRIARDVLAIPGAISPVERLFSKSRHLCTDQRSSLATATVTQSMCAKLWIWQGLFDFNK